MAQLALNHRSLGDLDAFREGDEVRVEFALRGRANEAERALEMACLTRFGTLRPQGDVPIPGKVSFVETQGRENLYDDQPRVRSESPAHRDELTVDVLEDMTVQDLLVDAPENWSQGRTLYGGITAARVFGVSNPQAQVSTWRDELTQHTPIWDAWADSKGELGPIYGHQWRNFGATRNADAVSWARRTGSAVPSGAT